MARSCDSSVNPADKGIWVRLFETLAQSRSPALQLMIDPSAVKTHRSAAGGKGGEKSGDRLIGRPRGGRTTKIHALTDELCCPIAFMITGGNGADCTAGATLLDRPRVCEVMHADKGYDANALCQKIQEHGAPGNIPSKANRKLKNCFSSFLYRSRNANPNVLFRRNERNPRSELPRCGMGIDHVDLCNSVQTRPVPDSVYHSALHPPSPPGSNDTGGA